MWLTQKQMESLFDVKQATISEHINNILASGELDETSIGFSDKSSGGRKPETLKIIRQAFSEAHIYFNSSIDSDLEHLRVKYIQWKKRQSGY